MGSSSDVIRKWFDRVWNNGDASYIDEGLCESCEVTGLVAESIRSPADFREFHKMLNSVLGDIHIVPEHLTDDGDTFAGVVLAKGTHKATGKPVSFKSSFFGTILNGKIHTVTNLVDYLSVLIQLGALPSDVVEKVLLGEDAA